MNNIDYVNIIKYIIPLTVNKSIVLFYILWMIFCVANSGLYVINTMLIQQFLDSVPGNDLRYSFDILLLFIITLCVNQIFSGLSIWGDALVEKQSLKTLKTGFFEKMNKIDPLEMNQPQFWDEVKKAKKGLESAVYIIQTLFFYAVLACSILCFCEYISLLCESGVYLSSSHYTYRDSCDVKDKIEDI